MNVKTIKLNNKKTIVMISIMIVFLLAFALKDFIKEYFEDNYQTFSVPYYKGSLSRNDVARNMVRDYGAIVGLISRCNKFPDSIKNIFDENFFSGVECDINSVLMFNPKVYEDRIKIHNYSNTIPWIDPWGRPYQIRYDLERDMLRIRSHGRYQWTQLDDINFETNLSIGADLKAKVKFNCDQNPNDGSKCIFNRGWH